LILDKNKIEKILVIKFGGMGDILLTTPVLPNLKAYFPKAEIYFLTLEHSRDLLFDNPYLTRTFTYTPSEDDSLCLIRNIRKQKYDLVIDLYCNPRTAMITFCSGAKYRFGFRFRGRKYAYNIMTDGRGGEVHNIDFNLDALRKLEIPIFTKDMFIPINIVHKEFADEFINKNNIKGKPIIGISKTGGWESKRYKTADYIILLKELNKIYDANYLLIWGTQKEREDCEAIHKEFPECTFIIPDSPLKYLAALIERCDIIIGNDSGPLHIACAMKIPVLGIYGPTNPALQGPYGDKNLTIVNENLNCLYCSLLDCPIGNICMTELDKGKIIEKIKILMERLNLEPEIQNSELPST